MNQRELRRALKTGHLGPAPSVALARKAPPRFRIELASDAEEGLRLAQLAVAKGDPYAVVFIDDRMPPEWSGAEAVPLLWQRSPDTQVVLCSARSDRAWAALHSQLGDSDRLVVLRRPFEAIEARQIALVLGGKWRAQREQRTLAREQQAALQRQEDLLKHTLTGVVSLLTDVLEQTSRDIFGRARKRKEMMQAVVAGLDVQAAWRYEVAALLSQLGCIALPEEIVGRVSRGEPLEAADEALYRYHPRTAQMLLRQVPGLEAVAVMIGSQAPERRKPARRCALDSDPDVARCGRLLLLIDHVIDETARGLSVRQIVARLREDAPGELRDAARRKLLDAIEEALAEAPDEGEPDDAEAVSAVRLFARALRSDMVLLEDVRTTHGTMVAPAGRHVTMVLAQRLRKFAEGVGLQEPILVQIPADDPEQPPATVQLASTG